jgi:hypothetical protein
MKEAAEEENKWNVVITYLNKNQLGGEGVEV